MARVNNTLLSWEGLTEFADFDCLEMVIKYLQDDELLVLLQQKRTGCRHSWIRCMP